jgi:copper resistance protein D
MDWFGAGISSSLVAVRAIHFAASALTTGTLIFRAVVVKPALRSEPTAAKLLRTQTLGIAWTGLAITAVSGVIWLLLQAASMSGLPISEALTSGVISTISSQTQFGQVSEIRLVLAIILAACLAYDRLPLADWLALPAALGLTAAIAWTGHAGSTPGETGSLHLSADVLHLIAAAGWIGGLVPLIFLLAAVRRYQAIAWAAFAREAAMRFSALGIASVTTLLATGTVNAWILVGSFHALAVTEYGRLLMLKLVVFAVMLVLAAVNRLWLTPRLAGASGDEPRLEALRQLTRNSVVEIALGFSIFAIVGLLGTLHPAIHLVAG